LVKVEWHRGKGSRGKNQGIEEGVGKGGTGGSGVPAKGRKWGKSLADCSGRGTNILHTRERDAKGIRAS